MIKLDTRYVCIPADGESKRRIYLHNAFNKYALSIFGCVAAFPFGYEIKVADESNGIIYVEIGPVPKTHGDRFFYILIADISNGRGYMVPIETTHIVTRIA